MKSRIATRVLRTGALWLALSMASAGIALASNGNWFAVATAYGNNGVSEALASTSYGVANAVDHNDVDHRVYSLVAAHPSDFNGYVGPFTLTRRLSSGAIDTAFGASGVTTSFANYNDPRFVFYALCIDPVTHGIVLAGDTPGGAVIERLLPPDAHGVAALDTSFNGDPPGVMTWSTVRPSVNVRPRGCTVLGDRSIFVAGPDGSTPSKLAMFLVSVDGSFGFTFCCRPGIVTPTGGNWEGGSIEWNSSQTINRNLIVMGAVSHNATLYAVDPCSGGTDANFDGNGFLSVPAIDGHTYSDPIVGAVQSDGSILLTLLASDTMKTDLVGWSYPVTDSWQTPTAPGTLTVPSGVVLGDGSSLAPVRQADGTILIGAETATNQQVLFALQGDAALGFTVAAPAAFSCGMGAAVAVPNVLNDTQAEATSSLTSIGLTLGTVTQQSSSTVASGRVLNQSPAPGRKVTSGTAVSLVMSTGSATRGSSGGGGNGGGGSCDWLLLAALLSARLAVTHCQKTLGRLLQKSRVDVRFLVATILRRTSMHHRDEALLTGTIAFCGIIMSVITARPAHAQASEHRASPAATIYVDCAATSRGNGSAERPYWRITDALGGARLLRREDSRRIIIRVAAGICSGNFETQPTGQKTRPPELLPLVLNVPDLTLHGAGIMEYAEGYPSIQRPGTATTVTVDTLHYGWFDNTVIYVGPTTDGGRADGTVIEGLAIDDAFNSVHGMWITRTQRLTIRANVVEHVNFAAMNVSDCSGSIVGNVLHDGTPGLTVAGGSQSNPSKLYVGGNSVTANYEGIGVVGNSVLISPYFEMGANPLQMLPYPINPTASEMGNRIDVEIEGNDVSNNYTGLNFAILGYGHYPYSQTGYINAGVHDNRFMDNAGYPFLLEEGFVFRGASSYWTNPDINDFPEGYLGFLLAAFVTHGPFDGPYSGTVNASFAGNLWSNVNVPPIAPAILTFSSKNVYDPATGAPDPTMVPHYAYMRNSRLNLEDEDGLFSLPGVIRDDLRPFDPLDGTALHNRTRITR